VIGERERTHAQLGRAVHQSVNAARAVEQAEVAMDVEMDEILVGGRHGTARQKRAADGAREKPGKRGGATEARLRNGYLENWLPDMNRAYRNALLCGACPLVVGVTIFLLWLVTRWDWLILAGLCTIVGGVVAFLIGAFSLAIYFWFGWQTPELPRRKLWRSTLGCAGLLLSNFVAAGAIIAFVLPALGWSGASQTQQIARVAEAQRLKFLAIHPTHPISGVTLHVHGHIEGTASINCPFGEDRKHPIAGDVDWLTGGDWYDYAIAFEYSPANVTSGRLTFDLTFH
jgi:hypothetical protein